MYSHLLLPTDGSELAARATEKGVAFARGMGARVTLFTAVPEYELPSTASLMSHQPQVSIAEHERRSRDAAGNLLGPAIDLARAAGVSWSSDFAMSNRPAEAIVAAAQRNGCDMIFMASHGRRGLSALLHGSCTLEVLRLSRVPTLVHR